MPEYGYHLACVFLYKDRIVENPYSGIFYRVHIKEKNKFKIASAIIKKEIKKMKMKGWSKIKNEKQKQNKYEKNK